MGSADFIVLKDRPASNGRQCGRGRIGSYMSRPEDIQGLSSLYESGVDQILSRMSDVLALAHSTDPSEDLDIILRDIALALAAREAWSQAKSLASRMRPCYEKAEALIGLVNASGPNAGGLSSDAMANEIELLIERNEGDWGQPWQRAELLDKLARTIFPSGYGARNMKFWGRAVEIARVGEESPSAQDSIDASSVLSQIAVNVAKSGSRSRALDIARSIRNLGKRDGAVRAIEGQSTAGGNQPKQ